MRRFIIEGENSQKHPGESRRNIVSNLNRAIEEEVGKRGRKGGEGASGPRQSQKLSKPGPKRPRGQDIPHPSVAEITEDQKLGEGR